MEVVHTRCAGMDVSKKDAKVCVRVAGAGRRKTVETVTTWGSMTSQILALREHLAEQRVTCVVMEATGDYWKPFYYLLEDLPDVAVMLVNARHVKTVPGRKTDVADATWLAQLGAHGLVKASFVPPEPIRQLRDLTRARTAITRERAREAQRLEKLLEDAGIKLSAVASDILGVSGRAMLAALIAGNDDPAALADLAKRRLRSKIPELTEALHGRFNQHHAFLAQVHLDLIDRHTAAINKLTARIEVMMEPFQGFHDLICTIPGISTLTADVIIAETGADMSRFPTAKHLASWAGTTPGNNESAGKVKSSRTRPRDVIIILRVVDPIARYDDVAPAFGPEPLCFELAHHVIRLRLTTNSIALLLDPARYARGVRNCRSGDDQRRPLLRVDFDDELPAVTPC